NAVLLTPLPYREPERLVMLWERNSATGMEQEMVTPPDLADWQTAQRVFEHLAYWTGDFDFNLVTTDGSEKRKASYVSASLFPALGVQPHTGRAFLPEEDQRENNRVAVVSLEFAQQRYGDADKAIGQNLTFDTYGRRDYTVVGVMPQGFQFPGKTEVWLPAGWNGIPRDRRGGHWLTVLARLNPGVTQARAQAEMNAIQARIHAQFASHNVGSQVVLVPLLEQTVGRNLQTALWILWAAVAAVLLIACANVANLTLARALTRQKEIVIRLALGATRRQVVRQLLTESLLLACAGSALGLLLVVWGLNVLRATSGRQLPRLQTAQLDARVLVFTLLAAMLTSLLCGLAPAWQATRQNLNDALKEGGKSATAGRARNRLRAGLVVAEVALSLLLLIGAGLMLTSFARLAGVNRGFKADHLLVAKLDFSVSGFTSWVRPTTTRPQVALLELMQRLQSQPGVQGVAVVSALARGVEPSRQGIVFESRQFPATPRADFLGISPDYFRTLDVPLRQGRAFTEHDIYEAPGVAIVNESFAQRYFPNDNPLGQRLAMEGRTPGQPGSPNPGQTSSWIEIVGVVADTKRLNLNAVALPEVYVPYWQWPMQSPELLMRTAAPTAQAAAMIRQEVKGLNKNIPAPKPETMDAQLSGLVAQPRLQTALLTLFGLIALLLAATGIYSVMAHAVAERTHELGIRLALGAQSGDIAWLVVGQGIKLVALGLALGLAGAWAATRVLRGILYGVSVTDPLTFAGIALLLLAVALVACWIPARRAARVDPLAALRAE
ncbi:MAG TPA: ABC transporter permease, partial [Blastocatellia bacterium]|nr:ABC transporter permease [Blastocatellia bacterium]